MLAKTPQWFRVVLGLWKLRLKKTVLPQDSQNKYTEAAFFSSSISLLRLMKVWHILEGYLTTFKPPEIELYNRDPRNNFKALGLNHQRYSSDIQRYMNMTEDYKITVLSEKKCKSLFGREGPNTLILQCK